MLKKLLLKKKKQMGKLWDNIFGLFEKINKLEVINIKNGQKDKI